MAVSPLAGARGRREGERGREREEKSKARASRRLLVKNEKKKLEKVTKEISFLHPYFSLSRSSLALIFHTSTFDNSKPI